MRHYEQIKSIADWIRHIDKNGNYTDIYTEWFTTTTEQKLIELDNLVDIIKGFMYDESDPIWVSNFEDAIMKVVKIQIELEGGNKNEI